MSLALREISDVFKGNVPIVKQTVAIVIDVFVWGVQAALATAASMAKGLGEEHMPASRH